MDDDLKKKKLAFDEAAADHYRAAVRESELRGEKRQVDLTCSGYRSQVHDYNLRIEQIGEIIQKLTSENVWGAVPQKINEASVQLTKTQKRYDNSIKCSGITANSIVSVYKYDTVPGNPYSAAALENYRAAQRELERLVAELEARIRACEAMLRDLNSQIRYWQNEQDEAWLIMRKMKM